MAKLAECLKVLEKGNEMTVLHCLAFKKKT